MTDRSGYFHRPVGISCHSIGSLGIFDVESRVNMDVGLCDGSCVGYGSGEKGVVDIFYCDDWLEVETRFRLGWCEFRCVGIGVFRCELDRDSAVCRGQVEGRRVSW